MYVRSVCGQVRFDARGLGVLVCVLRVSVSTVCVCVVYRVLIHGHLQARTLLGWSNTQAELERVAAACFERVCCDLGLQRASKVLAWNV